MKKLLFMIYLSATLLAVHAEGKHALVIGVSEYRRYSDAGLQWNDIHGANDARLLSATLRRQGFSVVTLTDKAATAGNIRKGLARVARIVHAGDLVYIQFSGHGQPYEDESGDEADGWDEAIVPYDAAARYAGGIYEGGSHITDDELNACVTAIRRKAGQGGFVYVVIDACHAGGSARGVEEDGEAVFVRGSMTGFSPHGRTYVPRIDARANIRVTEGQGLAGVCYIEACRAYQVNCEIRQEGQYYGPLSYYVSKVLSAETLTAGLSWVERVRDLMGADRRLASQNMVTERSR